MTVRIEHWGGRWRVDISGRHYTGCGFDIDIERALLTAYWNMVDGESTWLQMRCFI